MSICEHIEFQCPSCNSSQTIEIWRSINTQENPELKKELFEGRINVFTVLSVTSKEAFRWIYFTMMLKINFAFSFSF